MIQGGQAAVLVFFVLSGFVLSRPFLAEPPSGWRGYYPRRLLRLYLPVWGALLLTWGLATVAAHWGTVGPGSWLHRPLRAGVPYIGQGALLPHIGDTFDGPL